MLLIESLFVTFFVVNYSDVGHKIYNIFTGQIMDILSTVVSTVTMSEI